MTAMKISVLDQSPVRQGVSPDVSIRDTIALAQHCETLGYHRFWLSEHHSSEALAGTAPEILMAAIAATTGRIRVGSAGIMLPHYSALKVAEQFRVLEAIAPGRIDLGVGRAPGSDGRTAMALNPNAAQAAAAFPNMLRDLQAWSSSGNLPETHPFAAVRAEPAGPYAPEIWVLGSSDYGAQVAAFFGLPYCFAYFFNDGAGAREALDLYQETYRPSALNPRPHAAITVWALAAESREEAEHQYQARALSRVMYERGRFMPMLSPEQAALVELSPAERANMVRRRQIALLGTPAEVAAGLEDLVAETGVDEIVITSSAFDPAIVRQSFTLLADTLHLNGVRQAA